MKQIKCPKCKQKMELELRGTGSRIFYFNTEIGDHPGDDNTDNDRLDWSVMCRCRNCESKWVPLSEFITDSDAEELFVESLLAQIE